MLLLPLSTEDTEVLVTSFVSISMVLLIKWCWNRIDIERMQVE
jgi:hypothetical protein